MDERPNVIQIQPENQPPPPVTSTQSNPVIPIQNGSNKSKKKLTISIALILVLIIAVLAVLYAVDHHKKTIQTKTTAAVSTLKPTKKPNSAVTDTWTGAGSNSDWSNASNWSNGVPKTNYGLIFDLAPNSSSGQITSNNDLTGLTLNSLTFEGGTPNAHGDEEINLTGNPISLSNGIIDTTQADVGSSITFGVSLTSNQTFNLNGNLGFDPASSSNLASTDLNLGSNTLTITGSNGISFNYLSGAGTLVVNPTNGDTAVIGVGQPSPNFTGVVKVEAGLFAVTYGNSLGTATINVSNGATLRIVTSSSSSPLANNINLAGKGNADSSGNYFGAINIVGSSQSMTLSGKITLTNNTQLGIYDDSSNNPGGGTGTYTLTQAPTLNGYTLSGLTSNTKIVTQ